MRLFRPGLIARLIYPGAIFRIKTTEKLIFLTFDDGPDRISTPRLLGILDKYKIKAIFFCCGARADKFSDIISLIRAAGHVIGNHGWSHQDGWLTPLKKYINDIESADDSTSRDLFRPPYGHLGISQYRKLRQKYQIVFWDIMPYDFDRKFGSKQSLQILKKKIRPGSVIVLHDSQNSSSHEILEEFIPHVLESGYRFDNRIR